MKLTNQIKPIKKISTWQKLEAREKVIKMNWEVLDGRSQTLSYSRQVWWGMTCGVNQTLQVSEVLATFSSFWRRPKTTSNFILQYRWGRRTGRMRGEDVEDGDGDGLNGGHSPWLNHSSIVSQGSSSNAIKRQSRDKREEAWWKRCACVSTSCSEVHVNIFFCPQKSNLFLNGKKWRLKESWRDLG